MIRVSIPDELLFRLINSHSELSQAEYDRNSSVNDSNEFMKIEHDIADYLNKNQPNLFGRYYEWVKSKENDKEK